MFLARTRRWAALAAALLSLNVSLTFTNVWPTPAVHWRGELSIELAVLVIALVVASRWYRPSPSTLAWASGLWIALVIGRYAQVTAPALYGRDVNLYWDLRLMPDVAAMVTRVASWWLIIAVVLFVAFCFSLLYRGVRWAISIVVEASARTAERRTLAALATLTVILFAGERRIGRSADLERITPTPVTHTYARQVQLTGTALASSHAIAKSPLIDSDFEAVRGADIFLIFVESYGAVSFDRPEFAAGLASSRLRLEAAIRDTHRSIASAFVESPTFGGGSWLAHLSFLSGVEVRDPDTNALLMTQNRDTLARSLGRHGFRTVALMPGLRQTWPEGTFYGFDRIYGAEQLTYRGPEFGWFAIPDQFSLDRLDALEVAQPSRPPLFVFFPTISTHFPFSPTPPYQPDWRRIATARPYDGPDIVRAYGGEPDWTHFGPGYIQAMAYDLATIEGYLRERADRDLVMIVIGDHQPPAAVSGEGAPWDVPVHIIASRKGLIDSLLGNGFRAGLTPARPTLTRMHALLPILVDVFGSRTN